jgi:hypothetical protein
MSRNVISVNGLNADRQISNKNAGFSYNLGYPNASVFGTTRVCKNSNQIL